ncbi:MAG: hypothetical protein HY710_07030, partial [Candidatus Latescibacteria bacterium]|nr:hypothetical protein [Candidatus Latescibacterota bacterium]
MGLLYALCLSSHVGAGDDNQYLLLGQALATGQGYRVIAFPDAPVEKTIPPGYPMVLAPVLFAMGDVERSIIPLRVLTIILAVGFVWAALKWLQPRIAAGSTLFIALLIAVSPYVVEAAGLITADIGYAFVSLLGLLVLDRRLLNDDAKPRRMTGLALAVVMCAAAYLVRTVGIALLLATLASLALRRQYRSAGLVGLGFLVLALPWNVWILAEGGETYLHQLWLKDVDFPAFGRAGGPDI